MLSTYHVRSSFFNRSRHCRTRFACVVLVVARSKVGVSALVHPVAPHPPIAAKPPISEREGIEHAEHTYHQQVRIQRPWSRCNVGFSLLRYGFARGEVELAPT